MILNYPKFKTIIILLLFAISFTTFSQTTIYSEDFNSGFGGWTVTSAGTGNWINGSNAAHATGATGNYVYSQMYGGNYNNDTDLIATSPAIDLTGYNTITLDLDVWYNTENGWDGMKVEYSLDNGANWNDLGSVTNWYNHTDVDAFSNGEDGWSNDSFGWVTRSINLSAEDAGFDNNSQVKIRVLFATDNSITDVGVAFDTILIEGIFTTPTPEINIQGGSPLVNIPNGNTVISTTDDTDFGNIDTGTTQDKIFTIQNTGSLTLNLTGTPIVAISGNAAFTVLTQPSANSIASGGTALTFVVRFDPTTTGTKTATISIANNDTTGGENPYTFNVEGVGVVGPPKHTIYYENFDANNGSWTASNLGGNTVWTYGLNTFLDGDGAEGNHWYTNNYNNYANNSRTYATSPIIDLTGFNNLVFKIDIKYTTEADWDGMNIEYSTNGGTSWAILGAYAASPVNYWYNDTDVDGIGINIDGWSGENLRADTRPFHIDFVEASIALPSALNNNPNTRFRVQFASNGGGTDNGANFDNVIIQGDYITPLSDPSFAPGAVTSNLKVWLKANSGTSTTTDGSALSTWSDKAYDNDAIGITTQRPIYNNNTAENINFNPVINFDKTASQEMRGKGGFYSQDYFVVLEPNTAYDAATLYGQQAIAGKYSTENFTSDGTGLGLGFISSRYTDAVVAHTISSYPSDISAGPNATSYGRAYQHPTNTVGGVMLINVKTNAANNSTEIYLNGERIDNATGQSGDGSDLNFNEFDNLQYYVGTGRFTSNGHTVDGHFNGKMSEFLSYSAKNSTVNQSKIQSNLAIKYGITLHTGTQKTETDVDYVDSSGSIIWNATTNAGYNYHIAGIGRDDDAELNQKQSKTVNTADDITIGLTDIAATNSANINTFANDKNFLVWGNDQASLAAAAPVIVQMSLGIPLLDTDVRFESFNRKWKVEESGNVGKVKVSIPLSMLAPTLPTPGDYLMFVSDNPVFAPDAEYRVMTVNGSNLETSYNFPSNGIKYITFGYSPEEEFKRSIAFDGVDDFLITYDVLDLQTTVSNPTGSFTLSAWIKKDANNGSIISKRNNGATFTSGYDFSINASGNLVMSWINGGLRTVTSSTVIPNNVWHNVAVIYNGTTATLYIDGIEDTNANLPTPLATTEDFRIATGGTVGSYFDGNIDEVRVWDVALSVDQLRYIMNQEIDDNGGFVSGAYFNKGLEVPAFPHVSGIAVVPTKDDIATIPWANLQAYYPMSKYTYTNTKDESSNGHTAALKQITTVDYQTAPLPYTSSGTTTDWNLSTTWTNGSEQTIPGATSIVDNTKTVDWNIVETNHNISMNNGSLPASLNDNRTLLGLIVKSGEITVNGDNASNTGNGLTITHYLKLDGVIDLEGESQLIQTEGSDLATSSAGYIEKDQQGTANAFTYNYWSSPVSAIGAGTNNTAFSVSDVLRDGTDAANPLAITFGNAYTFADFGISVPINISNYWIYKFVNLGNAYANWDPIGSTINLNVTEGYTMKGTSGVSLVSDEQNYVFIGKPNNVLNGDTKIVHTNFGAAAPNPFISLTGNPFPSALDADQFIRDNNIVTGTGAIDGSLYFWEHWGGGTHILREYQGGYAIRNLTTGVPAASHPSIDPGGSAAKGPPGQYVPPGQGFYVISSATGGDVVFNNNQRVFQKESVGVSVFYRGASGKNERAAQSREIETNKMIIRVGFKSPNGYHRQVAVGFNVVGATDGFDLGYDAVSGDILSNDSFFIQDDNYFVIQAFGNFDETREIPLVIIIDEANNQGLETFMIDGLENVPEDVELYIKDNVSGETFDIKNQTFEVNLNTGIHKDRFSLVFKPQESLSVEDDELFKNGLLAYMNNRTSTVIIKNSTDAEINKVTLFNIIGQPIKIWTKGLLNNEINLPVNNISTGVYVIKIETNKKNVSKKIIIE